MSGRPDRGRGKSGARRANRQWERTGERSRHADPRSSRDRHGGRQRDHRRGDRSSSSSSSSGASNDEGSGNPQVRVHPEAAHMLAGETRFSSTMSYMSEGQRSDVATVGSGSVMEDVDVESIHSPDDGSHHSHAGQLNQARGAETQSVLLEELQTGGGATAAVAVVATAPLSMAKQAPASSDLTGHLRLALQESGKSQGSEPEKKKAPEKGSTEPTTEGPTQGPVAGRIQMRNVQDPTEADEVNSLGVEAHSVGEHSTQSLEEIVEPREAASSHSSEGASGPPTESAAVNPLHHSEVEGGGRRSPGGTIYKGRGTRRYQGRHMHLPLKRFHEGTSTHLLETLSSARTISFGQESGTLRIPGYDPRVSPRYRREEQKSRRERSRSRSRSPASDEEDRKPAARR